MSMSSRIDSALHAVTHNFLAFLGIAARKLTELETKDYLLGLIPAYIINAFVSYRDYKFEENQIRHFYEPEIAAQMGKKPEEVTIENLHTVGKLNPTIAEALRRNKTKRRMEFIIGCACITAAVIVTTFVLTPIVPLITSLPMFANLAADPITGFMAQFVMGMVVGFPTFMILNQGLDYVGKQMFGFSEPKLRTVSRHPGLQSELSLPCQVQWLERMQNHKQPIKPEQIRTLLLTANPENVTRIDPVWLEQLTADINSRQARAQELAFIAFDQASGVERLESPRVTMLEKVNADLHHKVSVMQQKVNMLGAQVNECAQNTVCKVGEKLGFKKAESTRAVIPDHQFMAREMMRSVERLQGILQAAV